MLVFCLQINGNRTCKLFNMQSIRWDRTAYAHAYIAWTGLDDVTAKLGRPLHGFIEAMEDSRFEKGTPANIINL